MKKIKFIANWYDGYIAGKGIHIYNPQSVSLAIQRKCIKSYWTQSETYDSLKFYINMDFDGLKESTTNKQSPISDDCSC
jgi:hypothetical protein